MFNWGPKQETPDKAGLWAALSPEPAQEPNQSDMQEALKEALTQAEVARKKASIEYQQKVIDENEHKNG